MALSASTLGLTAKIVMPITTPSIKVEAVRHFGGEAVLYGENFDEANVRKFVIMVYLIKNVFDGCYIDGLYLRKLLMDIVLMVYIRKTVLLDTVMVVYLLIFL